MNTEVLLQIMAMVGSCATVYAAIRADLSKAIATAEQAAASADKAHDRIDSLIQRSNNHGD